MSVAKEKAIIDFLRNKMLRFIYFLTIMGYALGLENVIYVRNSTHISKDSENYVIYIQPEKNTNIALNMSYYSNKFQRYVLTTKNVFLKYLMIFLTELAALHHLLKYLKIQLNYTNHVHRKRPSHIPILVIRKI